MNPNDPEYLYWGDREPMQDHLYCRDMPNLQDVNAGLGTNGRPVVVGRDDGDLEDTGMCMKVAGPDLEFAGYICEIESSKSQARRSIDLAVNL